MNCFQTQNNRRSRPTLLRTLTLVAASFGLVMWCAGSAAASGLSGVWRSEWGPVTLNVSEGSVSGSWNQGGGNIGKITGGSYDSTKGVLTFTYYQDWNKQTGKAVLTVSRDGTQLHGTWVQQNGSGTWSMRRDSAVGWNPPGGTPAPQQQPSYSPQQTSYPQPQPLYPQYNPLSSAALEEDEAKPAQASSGYNGWFHEEPQHRHTVQPPTLPFDERVESNRRKPGDPRRGREPRPNAPLWEILFGGIGGFGPGGRPISGTYYAINDDGVIGAPLGKYSVDGDEMYLWPSDGLHEMRVLLNDPPEDGALNAEYVHYFAPGFDRSRPDLWRSVGSGGMNFKYGDGWPTAEIQQRHVTTSDNGVTGVKTHRINNPGRPNRVIFIPDNSRVPSMR